MDQLAMDSHMPPSQMAASFFSQQGAAGLITLPSGDAAKDSAFLAALLDQMQNWARSPDIYAIILRTDETGSEAPRQNAGLANADFAPRADVPRQLATFWGIDCVPKPIIALLDGQIASPLLGLTAFVTHRVASESCRFVFPDPLDLTTPPLGGLAHPLARVAHNRGCEWALSGRGIGSAEAWTANLVTHCIPRTAFPEIVAALALARPVDPILDTRHVLPEVLADCPDDAALGRCFGQMSKGEILTALSLETGRHAAWAAAAGAAVARQSTLAVAGVQRLLAKARTLNRRDSLIVSHRLAVAMLASSMHQPDAPREPVVPFGDVEQLFTAPPSGDLNLQERPAIAGGPF